MLSNEQKQLNLLGLATRARQLATGEGSVIEEIRKRNATCVIVATDCSAGTKKKISDKCRFYNVPYFELFSSAYISHAIGKQRAICAFLDAGFAKSFKNLMTINDET